MVPGGLRAPGRFFRSPREAEAEIDRPMGGQCWPELTGWLMTIATPIVISLASSLPVIRRKRTQAGLADLPLAYLQV